MSETTTHTTAKSGIDWKRFGLQVLAVTLGVFIGMWLFAGTARYVVGNMISDSISDTSEISTSTRPTPNPTLGIYDTRRCLNGDVEYCD